MTQEEKNLILADTYPRLLYGVKVLYTLTNRVDTLLSIESPGNYCIVGNEGCSRRDWFDDYKVFLRPMSSMTEEEKKEYDNLRAHICDDYNRYCFDTYKSIDWLNEHHFDYRNLIGKGLALEAPEGMYKNN